MPKRSNFGKTNGNLRYVTGVIYWSNKSNKSNKHNTTFVTNIMSHLDDTVGGGEDTKFMKLKKGNKRFYFQWADQCSHPRS